MTKPRDVITLEENAMLDVIKGALHQTGEYNFIALEKRIIAVHSSGNWEPVVITISMMPSFAGK